VYNNIILTRGDKMKLKEFRTKHKYTQTEIAVECGASLPSVRLWEKGVSKPTYERKDKLIDLYKKHGETYEE